MAEQKNIDNLTAKASAAKVSDIEAIQLLKTKSLLVIREGTKIFSAIQALETHRVSGAPIVDAHNKISGVITEYDLLMQAATKDIREAITFNKDAIYVSPETKLKELIILFYKKKLKWVPVVDSSKKIIGIVHRIDILSTLIHQGK